MRSCLIRSRPLGPGSEMSSSTTSHSALSTSRMRGRRVARFADDGIAEPVGQDRADAVPHDRMIVNEKNPNHRARRPFAFVRRRPPRRLVLDGSGTRTVTTVPLPGTPAISSVAPACVARSRMPSSPIDSGSAISASRDAAPVVADAQLEDAARFGQADAHGAGLRVADDVGQRLLKDPEQRRLLLGASASSVPCRRATWQRRPLRALNVTASHRIASARPR